MPVYIICKQPDQDKQDENIDELAVFHDRLPVAPQVESADAKETVPHRGAYRGEQNEFVDVHFGESGRDGYQMPDDGNETADEYGDVAVFPKEPVGRVQLFLIKEKITAVFVDQTFLDVISDRIRDERTRDAAQRADEYHKRQSELSLGDQESGERHYGFTGNGQNHALHDHRDKDGDVTRAFHEPGDVCGKKFSYSQIMFRPIFSIMDVNVHDRVRCVEEEFGIGVAARSPESGGIVGCAVTFRGKEKPVPVEFGVRVLVVESRNGVFARRDICEDDRCGCVVDGSRSYHDRVFRVERKTFVRPEQRDLRPAFFIPESDHVHGYRPVRDDRWLNDIARGKGFQGFRNHWIPQRGGDAGKAKERE